MPYLFSSWTQIFSYNIQNMTHLSTGFMAEPTGQLKASEKRPKFESIPLTL